MDTYLLLMVTSTADGWAFNRYEHRWPWTTL